MTYKIIGVDGQAYGPVSAEQIRQWIAQNRVESRTPVFGEGATDWTFVGLLPEFAADFPAATSAPPVGHPPTFSAVRPAPTNGFAVAGLVFGILSLPFFCCCCGIPFNALGVIFSLIALVQISNAVEKPAGRGLAIAGMICSAASLLLGAGVCVVRLLASPGQVNWHVNHF